MSELKVVVFTINKEISGVDSTQVKELIKYEIREKMPNMPHYVDGVVDLRGDIVPVISLNTLFDQGETIITKKTKIIISHYKDRPIGFVVNDINEIVIFGEQDIENIPRIVHKFGKEYIKYVAKKGNKIYAIFDLWDLLTSSEFDALFQKIDELQVALV